MCERTTEVDGRVSPGPWPSTRSEISLDRVGEWFHLGCHPPKLGWLDSRRNAYNYKDYRDDDSPETHAQYVFIEVSLCGRRNCRE